MSFTSYWICVSENKMKFVIFFQVLYHFSPQSDYSVYKSNINFACTTFIRTKHDCKWCFVVEIDEIIIRFFKKFHISTTTLDTRLECDFILYSKIMIEFEYLCIGDDSVMFCFFFQDQAAIATKSTT